jgi:myo-inositol-1(or 4)-monophosphatase
MAIPSSELKAYLALGQRAARTAGEALRDRGSEWIKVDAVDGKDVKVAADRLAESLILDVLTRESALPVYSEERGWVGTEGDTAWVVDPLDGSANYAKGLPISAVSVAVVGGGVPLAGIVYDFMREELFSGMASGGAWLNGKPLEISQAIRPAEAILMTGLPARRDFDEKALAALARDLAQWRKVRMIGSAALALAYVAAGRGDCYHEDNVMFWDVAAGLALVEGAGGRISVSPGAMDEPRVVTAHNGRLAYGD